MNLLPGWKTIIAAVLAALVAANAILHVVPDDVQNAILAAAAALGFYGLHDQAERNTAAIVEKPAGVVAVQVDPAGRIQAPAVTLPVAPLAPKKGVLGP